MKKFSLILTVLILSLGILGCSNGSTDSDGGGSGKLTITDIPNEHIGKYIGGYVTTSSSVADQLKFAAKTPPTSSKNNTGVKITGDSVSLNVYQWKPGVTSGFSGYFGSVTIPAVENVGNNGSVRFLIENNPTFESRGGDYIHIDSFTFNNGSATLSFLDLKHYLF